MRSWGAGQADIDRELAKLPAEAPPEALELAEEEEGRAVILFLAMETQWNRVGLGGMRTGLNYLAIETTARLAGVSLEPTDRLLGDLRELEAEVLRADAERAKRG